MRAAGAGRPFSAGVLLALALGAVLFVRPEAARGEPTPIRRNEPHAGYVYPGGGQVGTTFTVVVGGQYLRGAVGARFSGEGITAKVGRYLPPPRFLNGLERREFIRRLTELWNKKAVVTPGAEPVGGRRARAQPPVKDEKGEPVKLPKHPYLDNLDSLSLVELQAAARYFLVRRPELQRKRSIEETVELEVTIAPDADPGWREVRVVTQGGVTNPVRFRVGTLPEVVEREPNHEVADARARQFGLPPIPTADLPVVFNGQILPRDHDRFTFRAKAGQHVVARMDARSLVPYQADSVPGWMQGTLAVYDAQGQEVAFADEFRYDPDPVLTWRVPEDGEYVLEVRDAVSRGRDDFVYRVEVGELPLIERCFPRGGPAGSLVRAAIQGVNLKWRQLPLDTRPGALGLRSMAWRQGDGLTNEIVYEVDTLPEVLEAEPNGDLETAPLLDQGVIVNGTIDEPGDVDVFAFEGRGGRELAVEVTARRLGSPIDSVVRLLNEKGEVLAWNDDHVPEGLRVRAVGLQTHHADSYLLVKLPKSGRYFVRIADVTRQGSPNHVYRLRVGPPRPSADVYVTPSSLSIPAGRAALLSVCAVRKDGYDGPIDLELVDPPAGFSIGGARIPQGQDRVEMTLTAPTQASGEVVPLTFRARVTADREERELPVVPADDVMQAFLWRHIVPAQEFTAAVLASGRVPVVALEDDDPIRVRRGGKAKARFQVGARRGRAQLRGMVVEAVEAPKGVTLGKLEPTPEGFSLEIKASRAAERTGIVENLIVEVFVERERNRRRSKGTEKVRISLGYLPAIPIRISR